MKSSKGKQVGGFVVGEAYFIRTVTHHYTGRVVSVGEDYVELSDAAWIPDDGRLSIALSTGNLDEIEPYPSGVNVLVFRGSFIDASIWKHPLPSMAK